MSPGSPFRKRRFRRSPTFATVSLDVRRLPPAQRHALIFQTCGKLPVGEAIVLVNDHDPKPLRYQFDAESPGQFGFSYLEAGPDVWRVEIKRLAKA